MKLPPTVILNVAREEDRDRYWVDDETRRLRRELRPFAVEPVTPRNDSDEGGRGVDPVMIGGLAVQLEPALDSLSGLLNAVLAWVRTRPQRTVYVKIQDDEIAIRGATLEESRELVHAFVHRHRSAAGH